MEAHEEGRAITPKGVMAFFIARSPDRAAQIALSISDVLGQTNAEPPLGLERRARFSRSRNFWQLFGCILVRLARVECIENGNLTRAGVVSTPHGVTE